MRIGAPCTAAASEAPADSLKSTSPAWSARTPVVPGACTNVAVNPSSRSKPSTEATCIGSMVNTGEGNTKRTSPRAGGLGCAAVAGAAPALADASVRAAAGGGAAPADGPPGAGACPPAEQAAIPSTARIAARGRRQFMAVDSDQTVAELVVEVDAVEVEPAHPRALAGVVDRQLLQLPRGAVALQQVEGAPTVLLVGVHVPPE